jgi:nitroimidazol reductase NimA-like FMN-containing flavoprotein (pyridoxamine 5'-phosphate oxidase superfamily)
MDFELRENRFKVEEAAESVAEILSATDLCSIATVSPDSKPHIATAFFAFDQNFNLYIATSPETDHGQHLEEDPSIAVSIYSSEQSQTGDKRGLQIFGEVERLEIGTEECREAHSVYVERFESWKEFAAEPSDLKDLDSCIYRIEPDRIKVFDEESFGKETWINLETGTR